jgi:hypothetical protein
MPSLSSASCGRSWSSSRGTPHFDTRVDRSPHLTGPAARGIARRLPRRYEASASESFFAEVAEGEEDRGCAWGVELARASVPVET